MFQSTPPHGGRHYSSNNCKWIPLFQSTPPHGGRLSKVIIIIPIKETKKHPINHLTSRGTMFPVAPSNIPTIKAKQKLPLM